MIEVTNLTKWYGKTRSLNKLTFSVPEGDILGFLGPNGAGKTTTMRILTGLAQPTEGSARVGGFDVQRDHQKVRQILGYLPEESPLYPEMRVEGYLRFMAGMKGIPFLKVKREVERALEETDLLGLRKRLIGNMSKGMRQRVGLAQAILGDPKILILDEPTVGLDPKQINDVLDLIKGMQGRRTVIFSTHILPNVSAVSTHVIILNSGRIIAQGTPTGIGRKTTEREILIRAGGGVEKVAELINKFAYVQNLRVETQREGDHAIARVFFDSKEEICPRLVRAFVDAGVDLHEIREVHPTLDSVFLRAINQPLVDDEEEDET